MDATQFVWLHVGLTNVTREQSCVVKESTGSQCKLRCREKAAAVVTGLACKDLGSPSAFLVTYEK